MGLTLARQLAEVAVEIFLTDRAGERLDRIAAELGQVAFAVDLATAAI
jgi:short-subunit dehydrogenase